MSKAYDVVVIGAGLNGLAAAAYLAKAGKRVIVVEQRDLPGGATVTEALIPGFKFDSVSSSAGWLSPAIIRELDLITHGLQPLAPEASVVTPSEAGALTLWRDMKRSLASIGRYSRGDTAAWRPFAERTAKLAGFLATLYAAPALRPLAVGSGELLDMARIGRRFRRLGRADMIELLRLLPMSVAELLDDSFETPALKAMIGASGITGLHQGPRAAGTTFVMLHHHVGHEAGACRMRARYRGGVGNVANAFANAARSAGAEIRLGAPVSEIITKNWTAHGVVLESGEEITAKVVASSADAKRTLTKLVDVAQLDPEFVRAVQNIRARGVVARVHLALDKLPHFKGVDDEAMRGVISIAPSLDYIEKAYDAAKYGQVSERPYLEVTIPSLTDPSLAPEGKHAMSVSVQYAPYKLRGKEWDNAQRDALGDVVMKTLAEDAPGLAEAVKARAVLTPRELAENYGLPEGNIEHGELGLDQVLFMRPVAGWARYATPIGQLFLCGAGTHPGRAIAGAGGRMAARAILESK